MTLMMQQSRNNALNCFKHNRQED